MYSKSVLFDTESNQQARGASQPRTAREHPPLGLASMESVGKAVGDSEVKGPRLGVASKKSKKSAVAASTGTYVCGVPLLNLSVHVLRWRFRLAIMK